MSVSDTPPWLQFSQLSFRRQERNILEDISVEFRSGELTLLTGHNGSGKTTLLRIVAGLLQPEKALLKIDGEERSWFQSRKFLLENSCYLHQQPYLFDATVFDNIAYGLRRRRLNKNAIRYRVEQALQLISLEPLAKRNSRALSGGERQRVAIARAWVLAPQLMLMDEPVANLDKHSRQQCLQLINRLREHQIGVVLTSHEPQKGDLQINRHIHLYQGRMENRVLASSDTLIGSNSYPIERTVDQAWL